MHFHFILLNAAYLQTLKLLKTHYWNRRRKYCLIKTYSLINYKYWIIISILIHDFYRQHYITVLTTGDFILIFSLALILCAFTTFYTQFTKYQITIFHSILVFMCFEMYRVIYKGWNLYYLELGVDFLCVKLSSYWYE